MLSGAGFVSLFQSPSCSPNLCPLCACRSRECFERALYLYLSLSLYIVYMFVYTSLFHLSLSAFSLTLRAPLLARSLLFGLSLSTVLKIGKSLQEQQEWEASGREGQSAERGRKMRMYIHIYVAHVGALIRRGAMGHRLTIIGVSPVCAFYRISPVARITQPAVSGLRLVRYLTKSKWPRLPLPLETRGLPFQPNKAVLVRACATEGER